MIKRIKYGCFALLFITTLTLTSVVAVLASATAGLDGNVYLTYEPKEDGTQLASGSIARMAESISGAVISNLNLYIDYYTDENMATVETALYCGSVATDGSDDILLYITSVGKSGSTAYILSNKKIYANSDSSSLFVNCTLNAINNLDCSKVENASGMFSYCYTLTSIDLTMFESAKLTNTENMFMSCSGLVELDLTPLSTSAVTNMTSMFSGCSSLKTIYVDDSWSTESVVSSDYMFLSCSSLVGGNGTAYNASYTDATHARIDTAENPGYFTLKTS